MSVRDRSNSLQLVVETKDFFRELLSDAFKRKSVAAEPETEFYLVSLLERFLVSTNLQTDPITFMFKNAIDTPSPEAQANLFRRAGDTSLYMAGFFQENLARRSVDMNYYIELGGRAYGYAAACLEERPLRRTLSDLSERFGTFVSVIGEVKQKTTPTQSESDLLRLYQTWMNTGSQQVAQLLQSAGIVPDEELMKKLQ